MAEMTKHISNRRIRKVRRWANFLNKQGVEVLPAQDKTEESYVKTRQAVQKFVWGQILNGNHIRTLSITDAFDAR
jgi:hypothetical protein